MTTYPGIEIERGDADLSAAVHDGKIEIGIGEDWAGRHHSEERPQGYLRYLDFKMDKVEATRLRDWLSGAIDQL